MEEHLINNDRSSLNGSSGLHNLTGSRPKCQPIRIKALLDLWERESDDEDSEDKPCDSDNESDNEDVQSLPQDNSICSAPDNLPQDIVNTVHSFANEFASGKIDRVLSMQNSNHDDLVSLEMATSSKNETKDVVDRSSVKSVSVLRSEEQRHQDRPFADKSEAMDATTCTSSEDFVRAEKNDIASSFVNFTHSTPSITYKESGKLRNDRGTSLALINSAQSGTCNRTRLSGAKFEQNKHAKDYSEGVEERQRFQATSDVQSSIVSNKDHPANGVFQSNGYHEVQETVENSLETVVPVPQASVDAPQSAVRNDNFSSAAFKTPDSMYHANGRQLHSIDASQSKAVALPSTAGLIYSSSSSMSHAVTDTPMKRPPLVSMHPISATCHRSMFQSPMTKSTDNFSKNNIQTPSTILSHWLGNNLFQTPIRNENFKVQESAQTPGQPIRSMAHNSKFQTPRYFASEKKSVRRPLAETMYSSQRCNKNDNVTTHDADFKAGGLHDVQLFKVQEATHEPQAGSLTKDGHSADGLGTEVSDIIEKKSVQSAISFNQELKENRSPNIAETINDEKSIQNKILENKNVAALDANANAKIDKLEICSEGVNVSAVPSEANKFQASCSVPESREKQQSTKESIVNEIIGIQCSVPSKIPSSKQGEIITVKGKEYLVLGKLGQGMSGEVLRVQDTSNGELRAIKCANISDIDKETAQGCLEEISMLHKLQAPCIIKMFDYDFKYPMVYVVMEMGDTDLSCLLKSMSKEKHLPLTMILYYWTEMLTAVKHIHDNGVIHSDLKPANFLLVRGRLKLIDFGIASTINADMTSVVKNCTIGTLNYISPEALMDIGGNGGSADCDLKYKISYKSDVWSLGCILYSLVYGQTPFQHIRVPWAKVNAITNPKLKIIFPARTTVDVKDNSAPVPLVLVEVMRRCLQPDPKARPTVAQLLDIPYVSDSPNVGLTPPNIPSNILVKIKKSLSEDEWRQLTEILENRRRP